MACVVIAPPRAPSPPGAAPGVPGAREGTRAAGGLGRVGGVSGGIGLRRGPGRWRSSPAAGGAGAAGAAGAYRPMRSEESGRIMAVSAESTVRNATMTPMKRPTNVWMVSTATFSLSDVSRS